MVISGHHTELFATANYAVLQKKQVNGSWESASTNESWDLFWCEITGFDPHEGIVELAKAEGTHDIQTDDRGEYIEITQRHRGTMGSSDYLTRFRPYIEQHTEAKPWMGDS